MSKLFIATRMTRRHCTLIRIIWPLHNYGWGVCTQELKFARWNLHLSAEIKANEPRSINPNIQKKLETVLMCNKSKCYGFSYTTWYIQHLNCSVGNSIVHSKERKPIKYYHQNLYYNNLISPPPTIEETKTSCMTPSARARLTLPFCTVTGAVVRFTCSNVTSGFCTNLGAKYFLDLVNILGDDNSLLSQLVQAFVYVCSCSLHDTKFHSRVVIMSSSEHKQCQWIND